MKRHRSSARLILLQGMVGAPAIYAFIWLMLVFVIESGIDPLFLAIVFVILTILGELLMYNMVRPMLLRVWEFPPRITNAGVEFAGRSIPFRDIGTLTRYEAYLTIGIAGKDAKFPILNGHMGDADEFVRTFRAQAPGVEFVDMR